MWKLNSDLRLDHWKNFRHSIGSITLEEAAAACQDFWSRAPFTPYYLDYREPDSWPDPWQLVYENWYCDLAKALGMLYTIHLSDHGSKVDLELHIYQDTDTRGIYNLVFIDQGIYVLNLEPDRVVNITQIPPSLKLLVAYTGQQLKLDQY